jgi:hypothetical protein
VAEAGVAMPSASAAYVVAMLLVAATKASKLSNEALSLNGTSSVDIPIVVPTAVRLAQNGKQERLTLMVHAGTAQFGLVIPNPCELADALAAANRSRGHHSYRD